MEPFSLAWAAEALRAKRTGDGRILVTGVCTDTRNIQQGALFVALRGENHDGHEYVKDALGAGAAGGVVDHDLHGRLRPLLIVPDPLKALGDLAAAYRGRFCVPLIAVTGSVGKTSTRDMIACALASRYRTLSTEKNFNNEIGLPLTLFRLDASYEAAVVEMGMRGVGEIDRLARIARPTIGVITAVGYSHIERLGTRENIAMAKAELLAHLPAGGTAVLPLDSPYFDLLRQAVPDSARIMTFGVDNPAADVNVTSRGEVVYVCVEGMQHPLRLLAPGVHHLSNAAAAVAAAWAAGVAPEDSIRALESWSGAEGRMTLRPADGGFTVLDDCYNAGVESMTAALVTLAGRLPRRVAVLGDMMELGDFTEEAHRIVGERAADANVELLVTVGPLAKGIAAAALRRAGDSGRPLPIVQSFDSADAAAEAVPSLLRPGDSVLVKASHAVGLERVVAALLNARPAHEEKTVHV